MNLTPPPPGKTKKEVDAHRSWVQSLLAELESTLDDAETESLAMARSGLGA